MTPEAYLAALKARPYVTWINTHCGLAEESVEHGYLLSRTPSGDLVFDDKLLIMPTFNLSSSRTSRAIVRDWARQSTPDSLYASVTRTRSERDSFIGNMPSSAQLRDYYKNKHRDRPQGILDSLFPRRVERRMERLGAVEWVKEQINKQRREIEERRARKLWDRYYTVFNQRHVSEMSGVEFERFVGKLYTRLGYGVSFTPGGADQGVDLILSKDGKTIAVQAKRWTGIVGNKAVQEVMAGKLYYGCPHGWIVTSSTFSSNAVALAAKDPTISLVDGQALTKLCEQFRTVPIPDFSWDEWEKIKHVAERFA
jgi:Restriction endonuclease